MFYKSTARQIKKGILKSMKKLIALTLSVIAALSLTYCGEVSSDGNPVGTTETTRPAHTLSIFADREKGTTNTTEVSTEAPETAAPTEQHDDPAPAQQYDDPAPAQQYDDPAPGDGYAYTVYITPTGKRYHYLQSCAGKNATPVSLEEAQRRFTPCKKCAS